MEKNKGPVDAPCLRFSHLTVFLHHLQTLFATTDLMSSFLLFSQPCQFNQDTSVDEDEAGPNVFVVGGRLFLKTAYPPSKAQDQDHKWLFLPCCSSFIMHCLLCIKGTCWHSCEVAAVPLFAWQTLRCLEAAFVLSPKDDREKGSSDQTCKLHRHRGSRAQ